MNPFSVTYKYDLCECIDYHTALSVIEIEMANYSLTLVAGVFLLYSTVGGSSSASSLPENDDRFPQLGLSKVKAANQTDAFTLLHAKTNPRLVYLGSYANKAYYAEYTDISYQASKQYCENLGMKLVKLETQNESNFVYSITPDHRLWTSGQDIGRPAQVEWKTDPSPITLSLYGGVQVNTCVLLDARVGSPSSGYVYTTYCRENYYPLCQVVM